ncbi:YutD family protein [Carnobacterium gallinarum]|uniref:YutD family protein n=1 Tax=Carnobacterium gallinarum TaxID=2749 RepID=UPI00054D0913|nr:YutD family protein [Carnobacterium gallinarum]
MSEKKEEKLTNVAEALVEEVHGSRDETETVKTTVDSGSEMAVEDELEEENQLIRVIDSKNLVIEGRKYEIVMNYRDGFSIEKLTERYSDILSKYDYIVADWGFEQLRLKGFYDDKNRKVPQEQRIGSLQDYLYEFCNFGCAYFVLQRMGGRKEKFERPKRSRNRNTANPNQGNKETGKATKVTPKDTTSSTKNKKSHSTKSNQPAKQKSENQRNTTKPTKKPFVTKKVPAKTEKKPVIQVEKPAVESVKEKNGQRHFNIRRNDVEKVKNKE